MRLISCHIENFGKLHELDIDFDPGESVIFEENGWGKSTLAAFIRIMFYGFENEGKRDGNVNERARYTPWQKGVYGGRIVFEAGGQICRLERTFDPKKSSSDTCDLYDHETNLRQKISEDQIPGGTYGAFFFGIDSSSFRKTVFIGQKECAATEITSEISARIGRVSDQTADMGNYETVRSNLEKELNYLTPRRKTGQISRLKMEVAELGETVRNRSALQKQLRQIEEQIRGLRSDRKSRMDEQKNISEQVEQFDQDREIRLQAEQYKNLLEAEEEAGEQLSREQSGISGKPPTLREIDEWLGGIRKSKMVRGSLKSRREQAELLNMMSASGNAAEERTSRIFLVTGILMLLAGIALILTGYRLPGALLSGGGIVAAVIWCFQKYRDRRHSSESLVEVDAFKAAQSKYRTILQEIEEDEREAEETEIQARSFLASCGMPVDPAPVGDPELALQELRYKVVNLQLSWQEYQRRKKERTSFEREHDCRALQDFLKRELNDGNTSVNPFSLRSLSAARNQLQTEMDDLTSRLYELENQAEAMARKLEEMELAEAEFAEKQQKIRELQHRYDVISRTKEYLEQAKVNFSAHYMEPVRSAFDRYYRMISEEENRIYELDADFRIRVREQGGLHDTQLLSEGYQDLIGLCRRMAMIDAMYQKEKPFLIFDDPFTHLDDRRLAGALRFLDRIAEEYQVLYFSCSEARIPRG